MKSPAKRCPLPGQKSLFVMQCEEALRELLRAHRISSAANLSSATDRLKLANDIRKGIYGGAYFVRAVLVSILREQVDDTPECLARLQAEIAECEKVFAPPRQPR